jgi:hypothetical protein
MVTEPKASTPLRLKPGIGHNPKQPVPSTFCPHNPFLLTRRNLTTLPRPALVPTHPSVERVRVLSPVVKRPGREADHSTPSSPKTRFAWSFCIFIEWYLVKHKDNFKFTYLNIFPLAVIHHFVSSPIDRVQNNVTQTNTWPVYKLTRQSVN